MKNSLISRRSKLQDQGFRGFVTVVGLRKGGMTGIPASPGVYLVLRDGISFPKFRTPGTGGYFKGKDPNVSISRLRQEWVAGAFVVYVGQSGNLQRRIGQLIQFGRGADIGHWGGRLVWQLAQAEELQLCWKEVVDNKPGDVKKDILKQFKLKYRGRRPFANLKD